MVKYADAYLRYSTHMQDNGLSIEYQQAEVEQYCARNNIVVNNWYIDKATTAGKMAGRANFERYLQTVYNGSASEILIGWATNRVFRNANESLYMKDIFKEKKIKLHFVTQNFNLDTPDGEFMYGINAVVDERKISETSEQVKAAMRFLVSQKLFPGGSVPTGFKLIDVLFNGKPKKKMVPCEDTKHLVETAFKMIADGHTNTFVFRWLNEQGVKISRRSVLDLLRNEIYIGTRIYNKNEDEPIIIEDYCEAIISKELFEAVQKILDVNRTMNAQKRYRKNHFALTGFLVCGECGGSYVGHANKSYQYYKCSGRDKICKCKNGSVRQDHLEPFVLQTIKDNLLSETAIQKITDDVLSTVKKSTAKVEDKKDLINRQNKLQKDIAEIIKMKLDDLIPAEIMISMKMPMEKELDEVKQKIKEIETLHENEIDMDKIRNLTKRIFDVNRKFEDCDYETKRMLFQQTIEKIIIEKTQVIIHLRLNLSNSMFKVQSRDPHYTLNIIIPREELKQ